MGLKDFHLKLKAFQIRRFLRGDREKKKKNRLWESSVERRPSWMMPVSHGYHVVDDHHNKSFIRNASSKQEIDFDSIVVQREQIDDEDEHELWFFGVFDARIADGVTKYMQAHLFDKKLKESQLSKRTSETMRKAHLSARAKMSEEEKPKQPQEPWKIVGSATAVVINGEKLVMANMGEYRAVVCRDGEAHQISKRHHQATRRHWLHRFISGAICMPRVRTKASDSGDASGASKASKSSELAMGVERIDCDTEFVILASTGIWEVMGHQEAVNLIRHLEDPQEAAECLAKEALTRMCRSNISCLIIRFD